MARPHHLGGDGERMGKRASDGLDPTPTDRTTSPTKRGVNGQRLHGASTTTAAKRDAKRKSRNEEEAQKRALALFGPPEEEDDAPGSVRIRTATQQLLVSKVQCGTHSRSLSGVGGAREGAL